MSGTLARVPKRCRPSSPNQDSADTSQLNRRIRGESLRVIAASSPNCPAISCSGSSVANTPKLNA